VPQCAQVLSGSRGVKDDATCAMAAIVVEGSKAQLRLYVASAAADFTCRRRAARCWLQPMQQQQRHC
jgi:hypothetical protein